MELPESENAYARLTFDERCEIQRLLNANASLSEIGRHLGRSRSSIAREILRNRRDDGYRVTPTQMVRLCAHVSTCSVKGLCKKCWNKHCARCKNVRCTNLCERFTPDVCRKNTAAPFCCNGCLSSPGCRKHRYRYDAKVAQRLADSRMHESRSGIDTTSEAFEVMIETARPLIKNNGQSIAHVWVTHKDEFPCCERTFYRYVDLGLGGMKNLDLVAKCRYRPRRKRPAGHFRCPEGRGYAEYCALAEEERLSVVEIDCVEGVKTDSKVLFTMLLKRISFLLVFLLEEHTQECVEDALDAIHAILGERFTSVFPLILSDRGHEFSDHRRIEKGGRTRVYYCEPGRADQKGSIENRHRQLRRIVPKGSSLDGLTRRDAALAASHVNSMPLASLGGASPFDLAHHVLPQDLLEGLGLSHIAPNDIVLRPRLLAGD
jgi:IS30 family transposase